MDFTGLKIVMRSPSDDSLEIDLLNEIYHDVNEAWWMGGTTAQDFSAQLAGKNPKSIVVRINSNGGVVSDGVAIYNMLREKAAAGAKITTVNMGMAASIASVVFMAGDVRRMAMGARTMIHNAGIAGRLPYMNSADLRKVADDLDKINEDIAGIYAKASNGKKSKDDFLAMMAAETTLSGTETVDHGLATETSPELQAVALGEFTAAVMRGTPAPTPHKENTEMSLTMEKLVAEHPELANALRQEGREQANSEAANERTRIQQVLALKSEIPGYDAEIETMAYDGKTSAESAKARLFDLDTKARKEAANVLRTPAPSTATVPAPTAAAPVSPLPGAQGDKGAQIQASADPVDAKVKKEWDDASAEFRATFIDDYNIYAAARKAEIRNKGE